MVGKLNKVRCSRRNLPVQYRVDGETWCNAQRMMMVRRSDGRSEEWSEEWSDEWSEEWLEEWSEEWSDEWSEEWSEEWSDELPNNLRDRLFVNPMNDLSGELSADRSDE